MIIKWMMKRFYSAMIYLLPVLFAIGLNGCEAAADKFSSPNGYDLNQPEKFNMPESLLEISGIAFYHSKADTIYSVQDEDGRLFRQGWKNKKQQHVTFGKKGDYEDLAILNETVFILKSNGSIYEFPFSESTKDELTDVKEWKKMLPVGEYESLYANPETNQLYVLCKNCKGDKKNGNMSGSIFTYDPAARQLILSGHFSMDLSELIEKEQILKTGLKASALNRNPHTGEWYILSSVNKVLIVATPDWKVKSVHRLNSSIFNQPEGLAFDEQMNLYLSNEGDEISSGNILKFTLKP